MPCVGYSLMAGCPVVGWSVVGWSVVGFPVLDISLWLGGLWLGALCCGISLWLVGLWLGGLWLDALWLGANSRLGSSSTLLVVTDNTMAHRSCSDYSRDIAQIRWVSQQQLEIGVLNVNPYYVPPRIIVSLQCCVPPGIVINLKCELAPGLRLVIFV